MEFKAEDTGNCVEELGDVFNDVGKVRIAVMLL